MVNLRECSTGLRASRWLMAVVVMVQVCAHWSQWLLKLTGSIMVVEFASKFDVECQV